MSTIAAAIAIALGVFMPAFAIGRIGAAAVESIARHPVTEQVIATVNNIKLRKLMFAPTKASKYYLC